MSLPAFRGKVASAFGRRADATRRECTRGLNQMEGYLLWQAESAAARSQAESFADRLPWLTGEQRDEVVRIYTADRLEISRDVIQRIATRARELQAEYSDRYRTLRLRLVGLGLTALTALTTVLMVLDQVGTPR